MSFLPLLDRNANAALCKSPSDYEADSEAAPARSFATSGDGVRRPKRPQGSGQGSARFDRETRPSRRGRGDRGDDRVGNLGDSDAAADVEEREQRRKRRERKKKSKKNKEQREEFAVEEQKEASDGLSMMQPPQKKEKSEKKDKKKEKSEKSEKHARKKDERKQRKAAGVLQRLFRGHVQRSELAGHRRAATMVQAYIRRTQAILNTRETRQKLAKENGVLVACKGTIQGYSGWYHQEEDGEKYYFTVENDTNSWGLVCGPVECQTWVIFMKQVEESTEELLALPGTVDGKSGYYSNSKRQVVHVNHDRE